MMQVMLGMLPMLVKEHLEMKGGKGGKDLNRERGGKISGRKGRRSGEKYLRRKGGKDLWEEKGNLSGGNGTGSRTRKGEKDFGKRRVEILGGKGLRGETGERILSGKGGGKDLREEKGEELRVGKGLRGDRGPLRSSPFSSLRSLATFPCLPFSPRSSPFPL